MKPASYGGLIEKMTSDTGTGGIDRRSRIGSDEQPDGQFQQTALPNGSVNQVVRACACRHHVPTASAMV